MQNPITHAKHTCVLTAALQSNTSFHMLAPLLILQLQAEGVAVHQHVVGHAAVSSCLMLLQKELLLCMVCAGAGGVESPELALFKEEIERLQAAAQAVRLLCTDAVRAGEYVFTLETIAPVAGCTWLLVLLELLKCFDNDSQLLMLLTKNVTSCVLRPAGLYHVQCRKFKDQLVAAADAAVHNLLDIVCTAAAHSNLRVFDEYQVCAAVQQLATARLQML
jgi:hypothetical protein